MAWDFSTEPEFEEKLAWMRAKARRRDHAARTSGGVDRDAFIRIVKPLQQEVKDR